MKEYSGCQEWLDNKPCGQKSLLVRLPCPAGRPDATGAYCDEHGGDTRARAEAKRDWNYLAPASVGGPAAVEDAGCQSLGSPEAYVVIRQTPEAQGGVWLAWLGLGSRLTPVANPAAVPKLRRNGKPRPQTGTKSFASREAALTEAKRAWKHNVEQRVAEIRRARGGTLDWGTPVEPLPTPIVIVLEQGDSRSAWDVATLLERRAPEGLGLITGLRPSGEAI